MKIWQDIKNRKKQILIGGALGAGLFYLLRGIQPVQVASVMSTVAAEQAPLANSLPVEYRVLVLFIVVGAGIGYLWGQR